MNRASGQRSEVLSVVYFVLQSMGKMPSGPRGVLQ